MKKLLFIFAFSFAFFHQVKADVMAYDDPIVLNEKLIIPLVPMRTQANPQRQLMSIKTVAPSISENPTSDVLSPFY